MAKSKQKSRLKPTFQKAKAKLLSVYYNNPSKDLKIIAVTGTSGRDITAHYLQNIIKHKDDRTGLIIDPASTSDLYRQLFKIWKSGTDHVVVSVEAAKLANHLFYGLPIHVAVLTDNIEDDQAYVTSSTGDLKEGKAILFNTKPNYSIINRDDAEYELFAKYPTTTAALSYGRDRSADLRINRSKLYKLGTEANLTYNTENFDVATYITSESAVFYMAAAALAAFTLDFNSDDIIDGIADYEPKE